MRSLTFMAGMQLTGTEIKSIRAGKASLVDSYCYFNQKELWVKGMHIAEYDFGSIYNHFPKRDRKLLLNHKELRKLEKIVSEKGLNHYCLAHFHCEKQICKAGNCAGPRQKRI